MPLSCCAPDMRSMRNGGDEAPKMQAAHSQVGRKDLQRPSYILTRNEGIFRGFGAMLGWHSPWRLPRSQTLFKDLTSSRDCSSDKARAFEAHVARAFLAFSLFLNKSSTGMLLITSLRLSSCSSSTRFFLSPMPQPNDAICGCIIRT